MISAKKLHFEQREGQVPGTLKKIPTLTIVWAGSGRVKGLYISLQKMRFPLIALCSILLILSSTCNDASNHDKYDESCILQYFRFLRSIRYLGIYYLLMTKLCTYKI